MTPRDDKHVYEERPEGATVKPCLRGIVGAVARATFEPGTSDLGEIIGNSPLARTDEMGSALVGASGYTLSLRTRSGRRCSIAVSQWSAKPFNLQGPIVDATVMVMQVGRKDEDVC